MRKTNKWKQHLVNVCESDDIMQTKWQIFNINDSFTLCSSNYVWNPVAQKMTTLSLKQILHGSGFCLY